MKCPVCETELVAWKQLPLETLMEHVSDPNGEPCLKTAYRCPKTKCPSNGEKFGAYLKMNRPLPALLWAELVQVLGDYRMFEHGVKGTRFDAWLKKNVA